jgi:hypothetical protein
MKTLMLHKVWLDIVRQDHTFYEKSLLKSIFSSESLKATKRFVPYIRIVDNGTIYIKQDQISSISYEQLAIRGTVNLKISMGKNIVSEILYDSEGVKSIDGGNIPENFHWLLDNWPPYDKNDIIFTSVKTVSKRGVYTKYNFVRETPEQLDKMVYGK